MEAATALPARYKINGGEGKYILKKIAEPFLPREIVYRKKMGFPVPTKDWFRGSLGQVLEEKIASFKRDSYFNPQVLDSLLDYHKVGIEDHSKILMTLLVLGEWIRQYA